MTLNKKRLKKIIKEEVQKTLREYGAVDDDPGFVREEQILQVRREIFDLEISEIIAKLPEGVVNEVGPDDSIEYEMFLAIEEFYKASNQLTALLKYAASRSAMGYKFGNDDEI